MPFAAVAMLAPTVAAAQIAFAGSAGLGLPGGTAFEDARTGDRTEMDGQWAIAYPLQLDVFYRPRPGLHVGGYVSYSFASVGGAVLNICSRDELSCSGGTFRIGIEGTYRLGEVAPKLSSWAGAGFGWEWSSFTQSNAFARFEARFRGPELRLQAGIEYQASVKFAIGPYLSASFGTYTSVLSSATRFPGEHVPIHSTLHEWISVGLRGRYDL